MTHDIDYVWIDVACVDPSPEGLQARMDEIQKEPGIYRKAQKCYVWLHGHEPGDLKDNINTISTAFAHTSQVASDTDLPSVFRAVAQMTSALTSLLRDPWFSTVWTLREILFRRDAILLDPCGHTLPITRGIATLNTVAVACAGVSRFIDRPRQTNQQQVLSVAGTRTLKLLNQPLPLQQLYDLRQDAQEFMLFCTNAHLLWQATESLLRDGWDLSPETSEPHLTTNHSYYAIPCVCDEGGSGRNCTLYALGVFFKE
jgi:Heterokaryon incompatibility protein (HET)